MAVVGTLLCHSPTDMAADVFPMSLVGQSADSFYHGAQQWRPEALRLQTFMMSGRLFESSAELKVESRFPRMPLAQ